MSARIPDAIKAKRGRLEQSRTAAGRAAKAAAADQPSRGVLWTIPLEIAEADAPEDLRACWRELAEAVNSNRTATPADAPLFRELVRALLISRRLGAEVERTGATYESSSGAMKANPAIAGWTAAQKAFVGIAAKFGCSPSDRDRALDLGGSRVDDRFAEFVTPARRQS